MPEFWLIVTLCAMPTISATPYASTEPIVTSDCAEFRVETSFPSVEACRLHQTYLNNLPLERRQITAFLCTAGLNRARLKELPLLSAALGDTA
jgi:hypothetical protein